MTLSSIMRHGGFQKLEVWRKAHAPSMRASEIAGRIRGREGASLRSQIVRAAASIPTNIVEGRAMKGAREFARFIGYSIASTSELEYHLIAARDRRAIQLHEFHALVSQLVAVRKMLYGLLRTVGSDDDGTRVRCGQHVSHRP
jgi:four helix bundle protein